MVGTQDIWSSSTPFPTKKSHWFGPSQLLGGLSNLLIPPGSPQGGWWIRADKNCIFFISLFSLLPATIKLKTLKASSTEVDSGAWGSASSFDKFFQISGGAWVIKCMANSVLFSQTQSLYTCSSSMPLTPGSGRLLGLHLFSCVTSYIILIMIYTLHQTPLHSVWKTSNVTSYPGLACRIVIVRVMCWVCVPPDEVSGVDWWPLGHLRVPWPFPYMLLFIRGATGSQKNHGVLPSERDWQPQPDKFFLKLVKVLWECNKTLLTY